MCVPKQNKPQNSKSMLGKKLDQTINYIISPGTHKGFDDGPKTLLPTGELARACREYKEKTLTLTPDSTGRVVFVSAPFFEAPWIQIHVMDTEYGLAMEKATAYQIPGYESTPANGYDPLKANGIYGYRFVAMSTTAYNDSAVLTKQGSVSVCSIPINLDVKDEYRSTTADVDYQNPVCHTRVLDRIPFTSEMISACTNRYVAHTAEQGAYAVNRHTDPNVPFVYRDSDHAKASFITYVKTTAGVKEGQTVHNPLAFSTALDYHVPIEYVSGAEARVTMPSAMNMTVIVFEGLDPGKNTIRFKCMAAWELIPKLDSPKIATTEAIPARNYPFLEALNVAEVKARCEGRAADNSLGTFLKGLVGAVSSASPLINAVAGELLPPKVSQVVSKVTDSIKSINKKMAATENAVSNMKQAIAAVPSSVQVTAPTRRGSRRQ